MKTIKKELFDLTDEQIEASKMIYDGKIIKCLVAPYHSIRQLEEMIEYAPNIYVLPEREMSNQQVRSLVSMLVANPNIQEACIVTAEQTVIIDMIDACVRILTEGGDIVDCPTKTFMANIHDIRYNILENEAHQLSKEEKSKGVKSVNKLIDFVNNNDGKTVSKAEYDKMMAEINMIGEPIIREKLKDMAFSIKCGV